MFVAHNLPDGMEPTLDSDATFDPVNFSYPHGTHLCAVEVDTETGQVKIRKYVCVDDIGTVVNPLIVDGQVHGGLAQGIAQALFEEAVYDESGTLVSGGVRRLPRAQRARPAQLRDRPHETPAMGNTLGVKGVGEAGTIASTPAVVNAVVDAVRPFGVTDIRCRAPPSGCGGPSRAAAATGVPTHRRTRPGRTSPRRPKGRCPVIPVPVRLRGTAAVERGLRGARRVR